MLVCFCCNIFRIAFICISTNTTHKSNTLVTLRPPTSRILNRNLATDATCAHSNDGKDHINMRITLRGLFPGRIYAEHSIPHHRGGRVCKRMSSVRSRPLSRCRPATAASNNCFGTARRPPSTASMAAFGARLGSASSGGGAGRLVEPFSVASMQKNTRVQEPQLLLKRE